MQEHPFLKQPFYLLHPCQTAEVLSILKLDSLYREGCGPQKPNIVMQNDYLTNLLGDQACQIHASGGLLSHMGAHRQSSNCHKELVDAPQSQNSSPSPRQASGNKILFGSNHALSNDGKPRLLACDSKNSEALNCQKGNIFPNDNKKDCGNMKVGLLPYMNAWFTIFGPAIGLKLPREMWAS